MEENTKTAFDEQNQGIVIDYEKGVKNPLLRNRRYIGNKDSVIFSMTFPQASTSTNIKTDSSTI